MKYKRAKVSVIVDEEEFFGWNSYSIESDFLTPSDAFTISCPNIKGKLAGKFTEGQDIKVLLDGETQLVGFIDDVVTKTTSEGSKLDLVGRDAFSDLVDCSAPPKVYTSTDLLTLAKAISPSYLDDWKKLSGVVLSKRRVKIDAGESKLDVLSEQAKKDKVVIWYTASGTATIGRPNYSQSASHVLRLHLPSSGLTSKNNLESCEVSRSMRERYSRITVYGHGGNSSASYAKMAIAKQSATDSSLDITRELFLSDGDAKSIAQAKARAKREMEERLFGALVIDAVTFGHYGEPPDGAEQKFFQIDQTVDLIDEASGTKGVYWIVKRRFEGNEEGQSTHLTLRTPKVWLSQ